LSRTGIVVKEEKERIDDLLESVIDMDQAILIRAELLDESLGLVANLDSECHVIKNDVKRSADLLNTIHERLKLVVVADDEAPTSSD
jgi:hypothetical protein